MSDAYVKGYNEAKDILSMNPCPEGEDVVAHVAEIESHARDFSPFEFTAKEFNESEDPEQTWADYERGLADGAIGKLYTYERHFGGYILTRCSDGVTVFLQPGDDSETFVGEIDGTNGYWTDEDVIAEYFVGVE